MDKIFLDNCSTTKPYDEILELFVNINKEFYFNINSGSNEAFRANSILQKSKNKIKSMLDFQGEIIYTSGATESNNLIIQGFFKNNRNRINKLITTKIEHPSIYNVSLNLENINVNYIEYKNQNINEEQLEKELLKGPSLVSICLVNNNTGTIINANKIYNLVKKYDSYLHLDITQGFCKIPIDYTNFDFASMSLHKIHGLKGVGLIFKNTDSKLNNIIFGGSSDSNIRPGTVNAPSYVTASRTIEKSLLNYEENIGKICKLNLFLREELKQIPQIYINNDYDISSPFIINFSTLNIGSEIIINYLEKNGIIVSSGSACSTKIKSETEKILKEFGSKYPKNNIRVCFEYNTTQKDIEKFILILKEGILSL